MKKVGEWHVPDHMNSPGNHLRRSGVIEIALGYLPKTRRRVCVQAGGHIGIWPVRLSRYFENIFTWEPTPENWECLKANIQDLDNVLAFHGALGHKNSEEGMLYSPKNTGKHCIVPAATRPASFRTTTERLDEVSTVSDLDALFLDVEGYELYVLHGAMSLLKVYRPLMVIEENHLSRRYGIGDEDILNLLTGMSYKMVKRFEEDVIYIPEEWE